MNRLYLLSWYYQGTEGESEARDFYHKLQEGVRRGVKFPFDCFSQVGLVHCAIEEHWAVGILVMRGTPGDDSVEQTRKLMDWFEACGADCAGTDRRGERVTQPSVEGTLQDLYGSHYTCEEVFDPRNLPGAHEEIQTHQENAGSTDAPRATEADEKTTSQPEEDMKECLFCHNKVAPLQSVCPKCGGTTFIASGKTALSIADSIRKQEEAREHNDRGGQLMMQGRSIEAEQEFRKAIECNPLNATAHGNLGAALYEQGRLEEAISWVEKALAINPRLEGASEALAEWKREAEARKKTATARPVQSDSLEQATGGAPEGFERGRPHKAQKPKSKKYVLIAVGILLIASLGAILICNGSALLAAIAPATATPTPTPDYRAEPIGSTVTVYEGPSEAYPAIGKATKVFQIYGQTDDCAWFKVMAEINHNRFYGWVRASDIYYTVQCSDVKVEPTPPMPSPTSTQTPTPDYGAKPIGSTVTVYEGPSEAYAVIGKATKIFQIYGQTDHCAWFKVMAEINRNRFYGWVRASDIHYTVQCSDVKVEPTPPMSSPTSTQTPTRKPRPPAPTATEFLCNANATITIQNDTGGTVELYLSGPRQFYFRIGTGTQTLWVCPGTYRYTAYGCGGASDSGTMSSGESHQFYCQ